MSFTNYMSHKLNHLWYVAHVIVTQYSCLSYYNKSGTQIYLAKCIEMCGLYGGSKWN